MKKFESLCKCTKASELVTAGKESRRVTTTSQTSAIVTLFLFQTNSSRNQPPPAP